MRLSLVALSVVLLASGVSADDDFHDIRNFDAWMRKKNKKAKKNKRKGKNEGPKTEKAPKMPKDEEYKEYRSIVKKIVKDNKKAHLKISKKLRPYIMWYNKYADPSVCTDLELKRSSERLQSLFNGIFMSRGFDMAELSVTYSNHLHKYYTGEEELHDGLRRRQLRGALVETEEDDRELWRSRGCGGWLCIAFGNYRRRRLAEDDNEGNDDTPDFDALEESISDMKMALEDQTKRLLLLTSLTTREMTRECRMAMKAANVAADFDVAPMALIVNEDD